MSIEKIQETRKELFRVIEEKVKPLKQKLDDLLNKEAIRICPFSIGDVIELENGKLGKIQRISYYSLDYPFSIQYDFPDMPQLEFDINYRFAYEIDNAKFSITWNMFGVRMIQNGTKEGKVPFSDINPKDYIIDTQNNRVSRKQLLSYLDNVGDLIALDPVQLNK